MALKPDPNRYGELVRLFGELFDDLWCAVAHVDHGDAGPRSMKELPSTSTITPRRPGLRRWAPRRPVPRDRGLPPVSKRPLEFGPGISVTTSTLLLADLVKVHTVRLLHLPFLTVAVL